ncbi:hypothetical protein FOI68_20530 [Brevibacillus sp. LEMMJ03]|uniref:hypothetical protein n=1 Tax=Brevibacillus sp. LEMMJ03 TaxID=2595056 RepID=UPI00117E9A7D|nr:hypothetical protein [Brevibacillus sp. LEMMJ03]TRY23656.1 hypothetical protein FOI68_20530 [Brevibacillus sp. LEMMJ03]
MKQVILKVTETLSYGREVKVEIPDEMTEAELNNVLDAAQREEFMSDFIYFLERKGLKLIGPVDEDMDSPDHAEIECDEYEFVEEEENRDAS